MIPTPRLAAIASAIFLSPLALMATDPSLDTAFVNTLSPGLTPDSYTPPPATPNFNSGTGAVNAVALQSDGKIIAGGNLSRYQAPPSGSPQSALKRLNPDGSLDTLSSFNTSAATLADSQGQPEVNKILTTANDKLYVGGVFTSYTGTTRSGLMRLNADGSLDPAFTPTTGISNTNSFGIRYVLALAEQADGKLMVGGGFNRANGSFRNNLARFNSDGSLDSNFNANAALGDSTFIGDIAVLPDGDIIVAGGRSYAGGSKPLLVRLNSDGTLDNSFSPSFRDDYGDIDELLVMADGRVLIGGDFTFASSNTLLNFACLLPSGTVDTAFMSQVGTGPSGWAGGEIALQADGTIFVGGIFKSWNGSPRASVARLQPDGSLDASFAPTPYVTDNSYLTHFYSFAFQPDGKLVAGGWLARVSDPAVETYNLTRFMNEFGTGPGTLRAVSPAVTTTENAGSVALSVSRLGGLIGEVSVSYSLTPLTAVPGIDYTPISGTLTWAPGVGGIQTLSVPILQDSVQDGVKAFQLTLSNPTGGAILPSANSTTLVAIRDDDAPPSILLNPVAVSLDQGASFALVMFYDSVLAATVQWQRDPDGDGPLPFENIPGATSLVYSVANADPATHAGSYRAVVTNPNGSVASSAATVSIAVPTGSVVAGFTPADLGNILVAAPDAAGRILAFVNGTSLRRLGTDGNFESTSSFGLTISNVTSILPLSDGRTLVGGSFTSQTHLPSSGSSSVSRLIRLNSDATGTVDTGFASGLTNNVTALAAGASGKFYVGVSAAATTGNGLFRYLSTGAADPAWAPAVNTIAAGTGGTVLAVKELADGKIIVSHRHGTTSTGTYRLSRLTSTGALDTTFGTNGTIDFGTSNWITSIDLLPEGKVAVTARFNSDLLASGQRYVAILNSDGTRDTTFQLPAGTLDANPTGIAYRDGRLLVWGAFTTVNGTTQGNLARFNLDGSVDSSFSAGVGASGNFGFTTNVGFYTASGDIFIGGSFTSFKGVARNRAALLVGNPNVGAIGFAPPRVDAIESASNFPLTLRRYGPTTEAVNIAYATADGSALAGVDYTATTGTISWGAGDAADKTVLIPLLNDTTVESSKTFRVVLGAVTGPARPAASATVTLLDDDTPVTFSTSPVALTNLNSGASLSLTSATSSPTPTTYQWFLNGVAISGATSATYTKNPVTATDAGVYTVVATNSAGAFSSSAALVVVTPQPGNAAAGQATSGRPTFISAGRPNALISLPDGGALVGGAFTTDAASNRHQNYLLRLRPDGSNDSSFALSLNASVTALAVQTDGKILVGGTFTTVNGSPSKAIARINSDLTLDTAFSTAVASTIPNAGSLTDIALDSSGRIYLGFNNGSSGSVARISAAGVVDSTYTVSANSGVTALAMFADDRLLVGGNFTQIGSVARNRIARIGTDGTLDTTFIPAVGSFPINDLLITSGGRIFAAGGTGSGANLSEINPDGSATVFGLTTGNQMYRIALGTDGRLALARASTAGSGSVSRLNLPATTGVGSATADTTFQVGTGPNNDVINLAFNNDGTLWAAGIFTTFNGFASGSVIKLNGAQPDPSIVNPPVRTDANIGTTARLSVGASGTGLTYQWFKNGVQLSNDSRISGATSSILTITNLVAGDDDTYTVAVTGGSTPTTLTSSPVKLNVLAAPLVVSSPANTGATYGSTVIFAPEVLAATPANYVWTRNGVPISNGGRYSGATSSTLVISGATSSDNGLYTLTITNALGTASTTEASLTVSQSPGDRDPTTTALSATSRAYTFLHLGDGRTLVGSQGPVTGAASTSSTTKLSIIESDGRVTPSALGIFNSQINRLVRQPDGEILVLGGFTAIGANSGTGFTRLVRLNPDLSLDTNFAPYLPNNDPTNAIVDDQGRIYVIGGFTSYEGRAGYNYIVRLRPDGTHDLTFNLNLNNQVLDLAFQPDGKILVAGSFTTFGTPSSSPARGLLRLNADGSVDSGFTSAVIPSNAFANNLTAPAVDSQGRILVSYNYLSATFSQVYGVARLMPNGSLDSSFAFAEAMNNYPTILVPTTGDKVLVGGTFTTPANGLFRLNSDGSRDTAFSTALGTGFNSPANLRTIVPDARGRIWIGGDFTTFKGSAAVGILVLQGESPALAIASQPLAQSRDLGGTASFTVAATGNNGFTYQWLRNGTPLSNGGRISGANSATLTITNLQESDTASYSVTVTTPSATATSANAPLTVLTVPQILYTAEDRTIELGGTSTFTASARGAGTLSYQWLLNGTPLSNGTTGGLVISGATTPSLTVTGATFDQAGAYRLRVTNTLGVATSIATVLTIERRPGSLALGVSQPSFQGEVIIIRFLADGSYLVGGGFTSLTLNGTTTFRNYLVRILANGTLDTAFAPSFNGTVRAIEIDSTGGIFVGGDFTSITLNSVTTTRTRVARFTSALALDSAFDTSTAGPTSAVRALAPASDGSVYVGGDFTGVGTVTTGAARVARLTATGALDTTFISAANNNVYALLIRPDGNLYIGGDFTNWGGSGNAASRLIVTSPTGTRVTGTGTFAYPTTSPARALLSLADGSLLVAGNSTPYVQNLNAATGATIRTISVSSGAALALTQQSNGKLLLGGNFTTKLYRTSATGTFDTSFALPGTGITSSSVNTIAVDATGRIYVGGSFTAVNGNTVGRFLILNGNETESQSGPLSPQVITFPPIPDKTTLDAPFLLQASSDSGLPVAYSISGPATLSGSTVTLTGAPGIVSITATQAGNAVTAAATPVTRTFTVVAADPFADFLANSGIPTNLRGPNDDADNDGLPNLVEYALDLNPNGSGGSFTGTLPTTQQSPTQLSFTYRRVRNDVTYLVESSPTLTGGTWTSVGVTQGTPMPDGTTTATIPISAGSQFLRLSVTR